MSDLRDQILDIRPDPTANRQYVERHLAGGGKRFANLIIDAIVARILIYFMGQLLFSTNLYLEVNHWAIMLILNTILLPSFYYFAMETTTGKTVGKYITRTKVVTEDGLPPDASQVLGRSLCRVIPLEAFSFLGPKNIGWHDSIPGTRVIIDE